MIKNYIITAFRSLIRNKGFSVINILGLTIGLASFLLISLYVYHEFSFDRYHTRAGRIVRIVENLRTENELLLQSTSAPPMGPAMARYFPDVEAFVRLQGWGMLTKKGDMSFFEERCFLADSSIFRVFDFTLTQGDPNTALRDPKSTVITKAIAKKYFGDGDPFGQSLEMDGQEYKVTGVMEEVPLNSHFRFEILISFSTWSSDNKQRETSCWFCNGFHTYLLLQDSPGALERVRAGMKDFITSNIERGGMYYEDLPLQPLTSIYLAEPRSWENGARGNESNLYILSVIAIFILLIASFNYVNLATARASRRLKEVGLRKVLGAQRRALVLQFLGESVLVSFVATLLGAVVAWAALPVFNSIVETSLGFGMFPSPWMFWGGLAAIATVIGIFSGIYPALVISGFQPLQVFRPSVRGIFSHQYFRKVLVAAQFVISITLVAGTLLVFDQLTLMRTQNLGFKKEATLLLRRSGNAELMKRLSSIRTELLKVPGVTSVAASHTVPGMSTTNLFSEIEIEDGKMSPTNINTNFIDPEYLPGYGIPLVAGRNFLDGSPADDTTAFIINETAMKDFGWTPETAIGKQVTQWRKKGFVIGVAKDFHYRSLHHQVEPLLMTINSNGYNILSIKINSNDIPAVVSQVGDRWKTLAPGLPYRYTFLDEDYDKLYAADAKLGKVAGIFSGLAIFVGCLGLLGLTSFSVERRVKEIGIRKVLGASTGSVIFMISREFVGLILLSFLVAVPLTYYFISQWLESFTNRIAIGSVSFIVAGLSVLIVAWLTVSVLSFRAAATNPSQALRSE